LIYYFPRGSYAIAPERTGNPNPESFDPQPMLQIRPAPVMKRHVRPAPGFRTYGSDLIKGATIWHPILVLVLRINS
jgi:hypothetical protein